MNKSQRLIPYVGLAFCAAKQTRRTVMERRVMIKGEMWRNTQRTSGGTTAKAEARMRG